MSDYFSSATHCPDCFHPSRPNLVCVHCGFDVRRYQDSANYLSPFTKLQERYVIGRLLGQPGGFGVVYAGWHQGLHCAVAIKEFFPGLLGVSGRSRNGIQVTASADQRQTFDQWRRRFLEEARLLARFRDMPSIVTVFDVFEANGTAYLVMERLRGQSLGDYLGGMQRKKGGDIGTPRRLPPEQTDSVLAGLLTALDCLHRAYVYHRDVTPNNVFFLDGDPTRIKLLDFGLASSGEDPRRGVTSVGVGTPGFTAPEQWEPAGRIGPATDFYALGATLYTALTGVAPPSAELRKSGIPLYPLRDYVPELSTHLAELITDCLALDPSRRPQFVVEIRGRLAYSTLLPNKISDFPISTRSNNPEYATLVPSSSVETELTEHVSEPVEPGPVQSAANRKQKGPKQEFRRELQLLVTAMLLGGVLMIGGVYLSWDVRHQDTNSQEKESDVEKTVVSVEPVVFRDSLKRGGQGPEMVMISPGWFQMGDERSNPPERPVHWVRITRPFALGRYEVTVGEYLQFVTATGRHAPEWLGVNSAHPTDAGIDDYYRQLGDTLTDELHPIVGVTWYDATAYAEWLSQQTGKRYRLPTEAEWEYAARAGTSTRYWWGDAIGHQRAHCQGCESRWEGKGTAPVGRFAANSFGIYDTVGNVAEWTCSPWEKLYQSQELHCASKTYNGRRTIRGGAWDATPDWVHVTARYGAKPDYHNDNLGFRVIQER